MATTTWCDQSILMEKREKNEPQYIATLMENPRVRWERWNWLIEAIGRVKCHIKLPAELCTGGSQPSELEASSL
jgi:hypothetical protein